MLDLDKNRLNINENEIVLPEFTKKHKSIVMGLLIGMIIIGIICIGIGVQKYIGA